MCEQQRETLGGVIRVHFLSGFPSTLGIDRHRSIGASHLKLVLYLDALPARMMLNIATAVPSSNSQYRTTIAASSQHQAGLSCHQYLHKKAQHSGS